MAPKYTHEELVELRQSPLVPSKPTGLPPAEEWMGSIPDPTQVANQRNTRATSRGKHDEAFSNDAGGGRRPAPESRAKSTSAPGDIILGPPKSSFPSASAKASHRPSAAYHDDEVTQNERGGHRDKHTRDGHRHDRDEGHAQDSKAGPHQNRRSARDDPDVWLGARQTKPAGPEDDARPPRRNGDRDRGREREDGGDAKRERGSETHRRAGGWEGNGDSTEKRNAPLRSREVASWGRDEDKKATGDEGPERSRAKEAREGDRRGHRGQERAWGRGGQQEDSPAWSVDGAAPEERKQAGSQADFEQWRARMKADREGEKVRDATVDDRTVAHDRTASGAGTGAAKRKSDVPLDLGAGDDKFFDMLGSPKHERNPTESGGDALRQDPMIAAAKVAKSSKFSKMFGANTAPEAAVAAIRSIPPEETSSEDRAGFQRILNLLGQQPQSDATRARSPPRPSTRQHAPASPPAPSPQSGEQDSMQGFFGGRSPPAMAGPKSTDGEFLLNLMRHRQQSRSGPAQANNATRLQENKFPSQLPFSNLMISPPHEHPQPAPSSGPPPGFFDEPARETAPPRDKLNPNAQNHRNAPYDLFQHSPRPPGAAHPPGLERRPPGFEQMPPGFGQPLQQQQQRPNMAPPPGFPPPQRGHGIMAPGAFGSRPNGPGMPPPPGLMNMGGPPPPGFSPPGFGHDGQQYGNGGFDYGQGFLPPGKPRR